VTSTQVPFLATVQQQTKQPFQPDAQQGQQAPPPKEEEEEELAPHIKAQEEMGTSLLGLFRKLPGFKRLMRRMRTQHGSSSSGVASGQAMSGGMSESVDAMIDYVQAGGTSDNLFRLDNGHELLIESAQDFGFAILRELIEQGYERDIVDLISFGDSPDLLLHVDERSRLRPSTIRGALDRLAKVALILPPSENREHGTWVYKISPSSGIDTYHKMADLDRDEAGEKDSEREGEAEAEEGTMNLQEDDYSYRQVVWAIVDRHPALGHVIDIVNYGSEQEEYHVQFLDGATEVYFGGYGIHASRKEALKAYNKQRPASHKITESATNPSVRAGDQYVDTRDRKPILVHRVLSGTDVEISKAGGKPYQALRDSLERSILSGAVRPLRGLEESAEESSLRFRQCPNCQTQLTESADTFLCSGCGYTVIHVVRT
jgi:hypothetical protein